MIDLIYDCQRERLGAGLAARFRALARDAEVDAWLAEWSAKPNTWATMQLSGWLAKLGTSYDVHGWLGSYPMHLLSSLQWQSLLDDGHFARLLDVGAGAGYVTENARACFDELVCTETSGPLRKRLLERGFVVPEVDLTVQSLHERFEVVSCFNVLDRTALPLTLLSSLLAHMQPGGRLLLSIPLPARPHVHVKGGTISQLERLPSFASDWESAARELTELLLEPAGLRVERLARVPYLSRGDVHAPIYVLDAALWVCRQRDG